MRLSGGTGLTFDYARELRRPCLVVVENEGIAAAAAKIHAFLREHRVATLNIAGPRESTAPGLGRFVMATLRSAVAAK